MSLGSLSNPVDAVFSGLEEPITQNLSAFRFVVVQRSAQIPRDLPVEGQINNLAPDIGFHFVPSHPCRRIAPHLCKASTSLLRAVIHIR